MTFIPVVGRWTLASNLWRRDPASRSVPTGDIRTWRQAATVCYLLPSSTCDWISTNQLEPNWLDGWISFGIASRIPSRKTNLRTKCKPAFSKVTSFLEGSPKLTLHEGYYAKEAGLSVQNYRFLFAAISGPHSNDSLANCSAGHLTAGLPSSAFHSKGAPYPKVPVGYLESPGIPRPMQRPQRQEKNAPRCTSSETMAVPAARNVASRHL